ncbi:MAG: hypothetical protein ABIQ88_13035 [Chitinophagaceae bacterium]
MKVDNLLGPYLYQYKKLSLPGIGLFTLDDRAVLPDDTAKIKTPIDGISFDAKTGTQLDDTLIQYIKEQTGKMKPLAEADLYSYIATAFQYLNIGKPFYFEGIGSLQKNKDGAYTFTAGTVIQQKIEEIPQKHVELKRKPTYSNGNEASNGSSNNGGRLIILLVVLVTLALIGWGGYYLYNKNTTDETAVPLTDANTVPVQDTAAVVPAPTDSVSRIPDSLAGNIKTAPNTTLPAQNDATATASAGYKFVFETTDKKARAARRYEQLKDVRILKDYSSTAAVETKDSLSFKIYTIVPCTAADTARVKEQLNAWYYGKKEMKVKIEQ